MAYKLTALTISTQNVTVSRNLPAGIYHAFTLCRLDIRKFSFAHRIIDVWNSLDESIIACDSINGFKNRIHKFLHGRGFI